MNILLIDDDRNTLKLLASLLETEGHTCDAFTMPGQAVEKYKCSQYDLVISDLHMPGMNGFQVVQKIKSANPEAKIIISSGDADPEIPIMACKQGSYAFFLKPFDLELLIKTLRSINPICAKNV
jgi:two-component system C4-dicarboxylate transport response regulator DctD